MSQEEKRSGLYYVIPAQVMDDNDLLPLEKLLYGILSGYAFASGKCFASDEHLSKRLGNTERDVRRNIKKLCDIGYISKHIECVDGNPFKKRRIITMTANFKKCLPEDVHVRSEADNHVRSERTCMSGIVSEEFLVSEEKKVCCSRGEPENFSKNSFSKEEEEKETLKKQKLEEEQALQAEIAQASLGLKENLVKPCFSGGFVNISLREVTLKFIRDKKDYTTKEILHAWECLSKKQTPIHADPLPYIEGTIKKARVMKQNKAYQNKKAKEEQCKTTQTNNQKQDLNSQTQKSENTNQGSSAKGIPAQTSLGALLAIHCPNGY